MEEDEEKRVYGIVDPRDGLHGQGASSGVGEAGGGIPTVVLPGQLIADDLGKQPAGPVSSEPVIPPPAGAGFVGGQPPAPVVEGPKAPRKNIGCIIAASIAGGLAVLAIVAGAAYFLVTSFNKLEADISAARNQVVGLQGELSTAQGEITTLESQLSGQKSDYAALQTDHSAAEGQFTELDSNYSSLKTQNEQHQKDLDTAKALEASLGTDLSQAEASNEGVSSKLTRGQKYAAALHAFLKITYGPRLSNTEFGVVMAEWRRLVNDTDDSTLTQYFDDFLEAAGDSSGRQKYHELITYLIDQILEAWQ